MCTAEESIKTAAFVRVGSEQRLDAEYFNEEGKCDNMPECRNEVLMYALSGLGIHMQVIFVLCIEFSVSCCSTVRLIEGFFSLFSMLPFPLPAVIFCIFYQAEDMNLFVCN